MATQDPVCGCHLPLKQTLDGMGLPEKLMLQVAAQLMPNNTPARSQLEVVLKSKLELGDKNLLDAV